MTKAVFDARVQDYISGLGFATQSDVTSATGPLATHTEVTSAVAGITFPPVPYNVPQSLVTLGNGVLAGVRVDRTLILKGFTYRLISLTGVNAALTVEIRKNGSYVPGTSVAVQTGVLDATIMLGSNLNLVPGDYVELWRTGLAGISPIPGGMYGTFMF